MASRMRAAAARAFRGGIGANYARSLLINSNVCEWKTYGNRRGFSKKARRKAAKKKAAKSKANDNVKPVSLADQATPTELLLEQLESQSNVEGNGALSFQEELEEVQKETLTALSEVIKEADKQINPVDKKAQYRNLPLDVDHFFAHMGLPEEVKSYNKVIHACAMRRDVQKGLEAYEQLVKAGFEPDVYTYTSLILLQRANPGSLGVDQAMRFREQMIDNGISPSIQTYGALIDVCSRALRPDMVENLLSELEDREIKPTSHIASSVLNMYLNLGEIQSLWDAHYDLQYKGADLDDVTYNILFKACTRTREVEKGLMFLKDIKSEGRVPTQRSYETCIYMCSQRPEFYASGFDLFTEMVSSGHIPDHHTLSSLLACCAKAGDVNNALRLSRQFIHTYKVKLQPRHYEYILEAIAESMSKPPIKILLDEEDEAMMKKNAASEMSVPESRADRIRLAKSIFDDMFRERIRPNLRVLNQYLRVHTCAAGPPAALGPDKRRGEYGGQEELKMAEKLFETLHEKFGFRRDSHTYHFMLEMYCQRAGEEKNLQNFRERMRKDKIAVTPSGFMLLLERYDRQEHHQAFLDTLEEMRERDMKIHKYWENKGKEIVQMVLEAREKRRLDETIAQIKDKDSLPLYNHFSDKSVVITPSQQIKNIQKTKQPLSEENEPGIKHRHSI